MSAKVAAAKVESERVEQLDPSVEKVLRLLARIELRRRGQAS